MGIDGLPLPAEGSTCRDGGDGSSRARTLPLRPLADGGVLLRHEALAGDVGRARQVKDAPVRDWVELAAARARVAETPAVFWPDSGRTVPPTGGGGVFETGAGGSAPTHVQQLVAQGHLGWDSLGELRALAESLAHLGEHSDDCGARLPGRTLDEATGQLLEAGKSPSRKVGEIDDRGSRHSLALSWAQSLADQVG